MSLQWGDLARMELADLAEALEADEYVVFGASFIRGALCEFLISRRAVNIHMGVSPFYRGSATNFWAAYDGKYDLVGATIHLLSAGLDSGPMLFHALPKAEPVPPFLHGMLSVRAAHLALRDVLASESLRTLEPVAQDKTLELRYSRDSDFTDEVASEYLARLPSAEHIGETLASRDLGMFCRPVVTD